MKNLVWTDISQQEFVESAVSVNRPLLRAGAIFGIVVEAIGMLRVLFLSQSGLGTLNNRIYFSFYLILFLSSLGYLVFDRVKSLSTAALYRLQLGGGIFLIAWHTVFNIYDISRSNAVGSFTFISALFFYSSLLIFKPWHTLSVIFVCSLSFFVCLAHNFSSGELINLSITVGLCVIIHLTRFNSIVNQVRKDKALIDARQELSDARRDFSLSIEQYRLIRQSDNNITFEWDIKEDRMRFSKEWTYYFDTPKDIDGFTGFVESTELIVEKQKNILREAMKNVRAGVAYQTCEMSLPLKTGEPGWFEISIITQRDTAGEPKCAIGMLEDVTESRNRLNQMEIDVQMDMFTGVWNKDAIERYGRRKLGELTDGQYLAALILDMDGFKNINDVYGHPAGDYFLKEVARLMKRSAPKGARVGRIGGDEFIVLHATHDIEGFKNYAEHLMSVVPLIELGGNIPGCACSIGLTAVDGSVQHYHMLYQMADDALYEAKRNGKGRLHVSIPALDIETV